MTFLAAGQIFDLVNTNQVALGNQFEGTYLLAKVVKSNRASCLNSCRKMEDCEFGVIYRTGKDQLICVLANSNIVSYLTSPIQKEEDICINDEQSFQVFKKRR